MLLSFPEFRTKAVTLSYDDGAKWDIRLEEIFNKNGLKCTFNLNSKAFFDENDNWHIKKSDVQKFVADGHEIAVHSLTHPHLDNLSQAEIIYEIMQDRINLENITGKIVNGCAYPFGYHKETPELLEILKACGIKYSRTTNYTDGFEIPRNWLELDPTAHHVNPKLNDLADQFLESDKDKPKIQREPRLFYLWGHSFEFDRNDNWEVIENFSEKMGNREEIWYATNKEIYDYVEAFRSLEKSADGALVKNNSNLTVFFRYNDTEFKISAGETIKLF